MMVVTQIMEAWMWCQRLAQPRGGKYLERSAVQYREASKGEKSRMFDEFVAMVGCHRKHAVRLLGQGDEPGERKAPRGQRSTTRLSGRR